MITQLVHTDSKEETDASVAHAVELLREGAVVALPTETVYGLGANAFDAAAVAKIFEAKQRPTSDPLIVHLPDAKFLPQVAEIPEEIAPTIKALINQLWPGPLTLLLPKTDRVPDIVTAGLPNVAVRLSENPIFQQVARELDAPIAAPSANRFGRISPTSAAAVMDELEGRIPLIIDGGACSRGLESTIIRVLPAENASSTTSGKKKAKPRIQIVRAGSITAENLKKFGVVTQVDNSDVANNSPDAPGQLAAHYAPHTPLRVIADPKTFRPVPGKRYALLSYRGRDRDGFMKLTDWIEVAVLSPGSGKLPEAALRLFFAMRHLDECGADEIIAEALPEHGLGVAMMDRLRRASV